MLAVKRSSSEAFQPTLPARGATGTHAMLGDVLDNFNPRSPHGERRSATKRRQRPHKNFNPRSPHGERQRFQIKQPSFPAISTHAPRTGSDCHPATSRAANTNFNPRSPHGERHYVPELNRHALDISTHAPRTGSDRTEPRTDAERSTDFNPRSPHGERRETEPLILAA